MSVVITGLGFSSSQAKSIPEIWQQTSQGQSTPPVEKPHTSNFLERSQSLAENSAIEALRDAGLWDVEQTTGVDLQRFGSTFSASKPLFSGTGPDVIAPEMINHLLRKRLGLQGESRNVIAACATGAYSAALGASWIEQGLCDVVLAGSVEPYPHPLIEAGFRRMGVVSRETCMRPFDLRRSGFVLRDGAAAIILESESHARARQAEVYARLSGWGWGADSHSAVAFNSNGSRIADVVKQALKRARLEPKQVAHVNAHGTATRLNDWIETQALIKVYGRHADHLMISATKSTTGHLLGAAGSLELALAVLALNHQFIPPTAHLEESDPQCALDYTPRLGHVARFNHAISLSFGFGGPIGALVVSRS